MKYVIELTIRADSKWEEFGLFYLSQEFFEVDEEFINHVKTLDWIDTLEYFKTWNPHKANFFKILDKCYTPAFEGDPNMFNEDDIYDDFQIYNEETMKFCKKFINQGLFLTNDKKIFAYVSIYGLENSKKIPNNKYYCIKDPLRYGIID